MLNYTDICLVFHLWNTAIATFQFLQHCSISQEFCVQMFRIRSGTQALHRTQSRLWCLGWSPLTWCTQWINNRFSRKRSLCIHAGKWVQHFMDSLLTLRGTALISYLFEVCLNLQSAQAKNEKVLECSWNTACMLYLDKAIMYRPSSSEYQAKKKTGGWVQLWSSKRGTVLCSLWEYTICTLNAFVWAIPLNYKPLD